MMRARPRKVINLALQGGGAHGAFTWGVLDRLLEDERLAIEGVSATSSGAVNAVALAYGLSIDGRRGARQVLADLWNRIGTSVLRVPATAPRSPYRTLALEGALALAHTFSPHELNPLNLDPLRDALTALIDFDHLRTHCPLKLYIAATQVRTGKLRLFTAEELSVDALLASTRLPSWHHAIVIDGEAYWDGGYAGNPALFPLFYECVSPDIVITLLHPLSRANVPTSASGIQHRTQELSFGTTFLREIQAITQAKKQVDRRLFALGRLERRLRRLNIHLIEADQFLAEQAQVSKLDNDAAFLGLLRDRGRTQADAWLRYNFHRLGRRSSVDLSKLFG
jgi:NTE family protein